MSLGDLSCSGLEFLAELVCAVNVSGSFAYPVVSQQSPTYNDDLLQRSFVTKELS
jgi:hypothetical protein